MAKPSPALTPFGDPLDSDPFYGDKFGIQIYNFFQSFGPDTAFQVGKSIQRAVLNSFFREVAVRGVHRVPPYGPVIFVCGPHANQFMDGALVGASCPRKAGFVMAKSSVDKTYLGRLARLLGVIPVKRPQDYVKKGKGTVTVDPASPTILKGTGTEFTKFGTRWLVTLANKDQAEIVRVVSDTELELKAPFSNPVSAELLAAGATFKVTPHIEQSVVFAGVHERLMAGGAIGIFPEGGSHDQPELLPLKAGVTMMAMGAMEKMPGLDVKLIPTGLTYFNREKFRSTAVLEFGHPISVPPEMLEMYKKGGKDKREACGKLLEMIHDGLKAVTVNAPDYETLLVIQTIRRLYRPTQRKLDPAENLELTRRLIAGYLPYKDEPRQKALRERLIKYNERLTQLGIHDHQVNSTPVSTARVAGRLTFRLVQMGLFTALALPGAILTVPIAILIRGISERKAKEAKAASSVKLTGKDVIASWKVLVAGAIIPIYYSLHSAAFLTYMVARNHMSPWTAVASFPLVFAACGFLAFFTARTTETLVAIWRSITPLTISLFDRQTTSQLRAERAALQHDINAMVIEYGPKVVKNFDQSRVVSKEEMQYNEYLSHQLSLGKVPNEEDTFRWAQANLKDADDVFFHETAAGVTGETVVAPAPAAEETAPATELRQRGANRQNKTSILAAVRTIRERLGLGGRSDRDMFGFDPHEDTTAEEAAA